MRALAGLGLLLLLPGLASATCPPPSPKPKATASFSPLASCETALKTGGNCTLAVAIKNKATTPIVVGAELISTFAATDPVNPPAEGSRVGGEVPVGAGSSATIAPGATTVLAQPVTLLKGAPFTCFTGIVFQGDPVCGNGDQRRQQILDISSTCAINPDYPPSAPGSPYYKYRMTCYSNLWLSSNGTCAPGGLCWYHDQVWTRALTASEHNAWWEANCNVAGDAPNKADTTPMDFGAGGPYGYVLWRR